MDGLCLVGCVILCAGKAIWYLYVCPVTLFSVHKAYYRAGYLFWN